MSRLTWRAALAVIAILSGFVIEASSAYASLTLDITVAGHMTAETSLDAGLQGGLAAGSFSPLFSDTLNFDKNGNYLGNGPPVAGTEYVITINSIHSADVSTPYDNQLGISTTFQIANVSGPTFASTSNHSVNLLLVAPNQSVSPGNNNSALYSLSGTVSNSPTGNTPTLSATYTDGNHLGGVTLSAPNPTVSFPSPVVLTNTVPSNFTQNLNLSTTFTAVGVSSTFNVQSDVMTPEPASMAIWGLAFLGIVGTGLRRAFGWMRLGGNMRSAMLGSSVATFLLTACAASARADFVPPPAAATGTTLFYEGNINSSNGQAENNEFAGGANNADLVFQEFVVPVGQQWTINSIWSNDGLAAGFSTTNAFWDIRQGMTAGGGLTGTNFAGGTVSSATVALSGNVLPSTPFFTASPALTEYTVTVNVGAITLGPGTYWITVAPTGAGIGDSYNSNTDAVPGPGTTGQTLAGEQAILPVSGYQSLYYTGTADFVTGSTSSSTPDVHQTSGQGFSDGVAGSNMSSTPEPSMAALWSLGGLVLAAIRLRRKHIS